MRRKNKNVILITILLVFISFSVILYSDLTSSHEDNTYSDIYNNSDYSNEYGSYFPGYNYGSDSTTSKTTVKDTRTSQIFRTVVTSILIVISVQIFFYLLFSGFNYLTFKLTFFPLAKIGVYLILSLSLTAGILYFAIKPITFLPADAIVEDDNKNNSSNDMVPNLNSKEITERNINLSDYNENISINRGGIYNLSGSFSHTIIVSCNGDVTLVLNNVEVNTKDMASIINKGSGKLKIETLEGTTNSLSDEGTSYYDSVIYSTGPLELKGSGILNIKANQNIGINIASNDFTLNSGTVNITAKNYGIVTSDDGGLINISDGNLTVSSTKANLKSKQNITIDGGMIYLLGTEEDSPIDTVNGYDINGGTLIALGKDIYETPVTSSKNYTICLKLKDIVKRNSIISLMDSNKKEILTFLSDDDFNSLIVSTKSLTKGKYILYKDGNSSGTLDNHIYKDGKYSDGSIVDGTIEVTSKITAKK